MFTPDMSSAGGSKIGGLFGSGGADPTSLVGGAQAISNFASLYGAERDFYDREVTGRDVEVGGVPTYSGVSSLRQEAGAINVGEAGKGLVGQGALSGLKAGMAVGSLFTPLGSAIGAGVGALAGTIGGLFAKKKVKSEAGAIAAPSEYERKLWNVVNPL